MAFADVIKDLSHENISFTKHTELRLSQRKLERKTISDILFKTENLLYEELQRDSNTYKLIYSYSGRYKIVIAVAVDSKGLKVVTAYKTSKKLEKLIKSRGMVQVYRKPATQRS